MRRRTLRAAYAALVLILAIAGGAASAAGGSAGGEDTGRPNIVVIVSDDQELRSLTADLMPNTAGLAADSTVLSRYFVTTPQCCPSRATFLTGQYGHNNGVLSNEPGYPDLRHKASILPAWLQAAGYRTAHVGKYLNEFESGPDGRRGVPPGWDLWHAQLLPWTYFDYDLAANGEVRHYGHKPADYLGRVVTKQAVSVTRRFADAGKPLYLQVDLFQPHKQIRGRGGRCARSAVPDPRDRDLARTLKLPPTAAFNERDVSDKPPFIAELPRLDRQARGEVARDYGCRAASLRSLDREVGRILDAIAASGSAEDTVVLFTSDNGFFLGEHRIPQSKILPYEEAIHMPALIRVPQAVLGSAPPERLQPLLANVDLAPTLLELAGAHPCTEAGRCRPLDGHSIVPLLRGEAPDWAEHRAIELEYSGRPNEVAGPLGAATPCSYEGVRTGSASFVRYLTVPSGGRCVPSDARELYSLADDPSQLRNLHPPGAASQAPVLESAMQSRLDALRTCAGTEEAPVSGRAPCE